MVIDAAPHLRRVRRDALPEEIDYRDDGCDIHPRCLTCPLPRCRYDEPGGLRAMLNAYRDQQVMALRRDGASVDQIAERYSLSRRTVFRILSTSSRQALSSASGGLKTGLPARGDGGNGRRQPSATRGRREAIPPPCRRVAFPPEADAPLAQAARDPRRAVRRPSGSEERDLHLGLLRERKEIRNA